MAVLLVEEPGARTLVQDRGFAGGRARGVPLCGAMDRRALALVNALAGNPPDAAALEVALTAPRLRVVAGAVRVALSGTLSARVLLPDGGEGRLSPWTATTLPAGAVLAVDRPLRGGLGMIALGGGTDVPAVLGSRSTCLAAGFGGFNGRALVAGDRIACADAASGLTDLGLTPPPVPAGPLRCVPGPQAERFAAAALAALQSEAWGVDHRSDRMGLRLTGAPLAFAPGAGPDIISDGIVPGAIQVPGNGLPIILLADAQTTGGYAKIATVIRADLWRLSQALPGDALHLRLVSVEEAEAAARAGAAAIAAAIATIAPRGAPDTGRLLSVNLIGGAVDARAPDP